MTPTTARYLVRFDDICPTMNWGIWSEVEEILLRNDVRPLLAVVPDNRDPKLDVGPAEPRFWERVRGWQERGWSIALHGYQHRYVTAERGVVGLRTRSEFAGLSVAEQTDKISAGVAVFRREGVRIDAWVAPAHSFDESTVDCLAAHDVTVISDGLHWWPYRCTRGVVWVPQQLWGFRWRPFGVWTVCEHMNAWGAVQVDGFADEVARYRPRIVDLPWVVEHFGSRRPQPWDRWEATLLGGYMRAGNRIKGREI
jgi:predicted deacetylase